jgi:hypothetical protein
MQELLKKQLEASFEIIVKEANTNNPMKGSPLEGMMIYSAIGTAAGQYKSADFKKDFSSFGISDNEIDNLVDEVSTKIINKYLQF